VNAIDAAAKDDGKASAGSFPITSQTGNPLLSPYGDIFTLKINFVESPFHKACSA
jgi:hypothetical protein